MWPALIVQQLGRLLPPEFSAEPRVHLGAFFEIDVSTWENEPSANSWEVTEPPAGTGSGAALATWAPPRPTMSANAKLGDEYEYAVEIYDQSRGRRLVAAIEIVSPANKDRAENRRAFATKCAALLQNGVSVMIVDPVTVLNQNLYLEMLERFQLDDPAIRGAGVATYSAACRRRAPFIETWAYPMGIGDTMPTLPLYLGDNIVIELELEDSYAETCRVLRIA